MLDPDLINALLPQTQCTSCGYPDCRQYAQAIASGEAAINQCPPGGAEGIARLARATGRPVIPLNPVHGIEGPRHWAVVDEAWCIGCTLCIKACPVDAIVGASKEMHTVIEDLCTGCELCIPVCPVDCIALVPVHATEPAPTGWAAWSAPDADLARTRYAAHQQRVARTQQAQDERLKVKAEHKLANLAEESGITDEQALARKREAIEAAMARARSRRPQTPS